MRSITVGPFNRVEGDLEVHLQVASGKVRSARVNSTLYRGFESIMVGKAPEDALVITPRICGICSVSQSMAAAYALADAAGLQVPSNGQIATNLILAAENIADHLTHFYLFFMPDFARNNYRDRSWYAHVEQQFKALTGSAAAEFMAARAEFLHLLGILAGKWPHTLTLQPGGSSRAIEANERIRLLAIIRRLRSFVESRLFGDTLESINALTSANALDEWRTARAPLASDFACFLTLADDLVLQELGRSAVAFMSYGVYPYQGELEFARGIWTDGRLSPLDTNAISEDITHSWLRGQTEPSHPAHGVTLPDDSKSAAYTWCKAPRLAGQVVEVGALARQVVDAQPLLVDLVGAYGANVCTRVVARLLEVSRLLVSMERWLARLEPAAPYCVTGKLPRQASGMGLTEAARGSLGHWLRIEDERLVHYQIIAPTTWNFSPRDETGTPGVLEQALVATPVHTGERDPVLVQHIVRSFDPCMVCTVH